MPLPVLVLSLALGSLLLASVCWVYVRHQKLGVGGSALTFFGVVLVGMPVWSSVDFSAGTGGISGRIERIESQVATAQETAETAREKVQDVDETLERIRMSFAQQRLSERGLYPSAADGHRGPATIAAIRRFQRSSGLPPTGELDDATRRALGVP